MKKTLTAVVIAGAAILGAAGGASATDHAHADGEAVNSPGIGSGNLVQAPIHIPANVIGNSVNVVGVGNAAHDNFGDNF